MRVIEAFDGPVQAVAVSPDGRFLAAAAGTQLGVWHWVSGTEACWLSGRGGSGGYGQLTFTPDGDWLLFRSGRRLERLSPATGTQVALRSGPCSGGVAVAPDGKELVATQAGYPQEVQLQRWLLPEWREVDGITFWSPFIRIAFSPDGEHIAGISHTSFELRFAHSFGLNRREVPPEKISAPEWERLHRHRWQQREPHPWQEDDEPPEPSAGVAFLTFSRDSEAVVFGWETEFRVMETRAGNVLKRVVPPGGLFHDAAFVGSGRQLVTVDGTRVMSMWSAESWEVLRGYDWAAGGLTCVAVTADGLAGVCGTDTGRLVVFDVDE